MGNTNIKLEDYAVEVPPDDVPLILAEKFQVYDRKFKADIETLKKKKLEQEKKEQNAIKEKLKLSLPTTPFSQSFAALTSRRRGDSTARGDVTARSFSTSASDRSISPKDTSRGDSSPSRRSPMPSPNRSSDEDPPSPRTPPMISRDRKGSFLNTSFPSEDFLFSPPLITRGRKLSTGAIPQIQTPRTPLPPLPSEEKLQEEKRTRALNLINAVRRTPSGIPTLNFNSPNTPAMVVDGVGIDENIDMYTETSYDSTGSDESDEDKTYDEDDSDETETQTEDTSTSSEVATPNNMSLNKRLSRRLTINFGKAFSPFSAKLDTTKLEYPKSARKSMNLGKGDFSDVLAKIEQHDQETKKSKRMSTQISQGIKVISKVATSKLEKSAKRLSKKIRRSSTKEKQLHELPSIYKKYFKQDSEQILGDYVTALRNLSRNRIREEIAKIDPQQEHTKLLMRQHIEKGDIKKAIEVVEYCEYLKLHPNFTISAFQHEINNLEDSNSWNAEDLNQLEFILDRNKFRREQLSSSINSPAHMMLEDYDTTSRVALVKKWIQVILMRYTNAPKLSDVQLLSIEEVKDIFKAVQNHYRIPFPLPEDEVLPPKDKKETLAKSSLYIDDEISIALSINAFHFVLQERDEQMESLGVVQAKYRQKQPYEQYQQLSRSFESLQAAVWRAVRSNEMLELRSGTQVVQDITRSIRLKQSLEKMREQISTIRGMCLAYMYRLELQQSIGQVQIIQSTRSDLNEQLVMVLKISAVAREREVISLDIVQLLQAVCKTGFERSMLTERRESIVSLQTQVKTSMEVHRCNKRLLRTLQIQYRIASVLFHENSKRIAVLQSNVIRKLHESDYALELDCVAVVSSKIRTALCSSEPNISSIQAAIRTSHESSLMNCMHAANTRIQTRVANRVLSMDMCDKYRAVLILQAKICTTEPVVTEVNQLQATVRSILEQLELKRKFVSTSVVQADVRCALTMQILSRDLKSLREISSVINACVTRQEHQNAIQKVTMIEAICKSKRDINISSELHSIIRCTIEQAKLSREFKEVTLCQTSIRTVSPEFRESLLILSSVTRKQLTDELRVNDTVPIQASVRRMLGMSKLEQMLSAALDIQTKLRQMQHSITDADLVLIQVVTRSMLINSYDDLCLSSTARKTLSAQQLEDLYTAHERIQATVRQSISSMGLPNALQACVRTRLINCDDSLEIIQACIRNGLVQVHDLVPVVPVQAIIRQQLAQTLMYELEDNTLSIESIIRTTSPQTIAPEVIQCTIKMNLASEHQKFILIGSVVKTSHSLQELRAKDVMLRTIQGSIRAAMEVLDGIMPLPPVILQQLEQAEFHANLYALLLIQANLRSRSAILYPVALSAACEMALEAEIIQDSFKKLEHLQGICSSQCSIRLLVEELHDVLLLQTVLRREQAQEMSWRELQSICRAYSCRIDFEGKQRACLLIQAELRNEQESVAYSPVVTCQSVLRGIACKNRIASDLQNAAVIQGNILRSASIANDISPIQAVIQQASNSIGDVSPLLTSCRGDRTELIRHLQSTHLLQDAISTCLQQWDANATNQLKGVIRTIPLVLENVVLRDSVSNLQSLVRGCVHSDASNDVLQAVLRTTLVRISELDLVVSIQSKIRNRTTIAEYIVYSNLLISLQAQFCKVPDIDTQELSRLSAAMRTKLVPTVRDEILSVRIIQSASKKRQLITSNGVVTIQSIMRHGELSVLPVQILQSIVKTSLVRADNMPDIQSILRTALEVHRYVSALRALEPLSAVLRTKHSQIEMVTWLQSSCSSSTEEKEFIYALKSLELLQTCMQRSAIDIGSTLHLQSAVRTNDSANQLQAIAQACQIIQGLCRSAEVHEELMDMYYSCFLLAAVGHRDLVDMNQLDALYSTIKSSFVQEQSNLHPLQARIRSCIEHTNMHDAMNKTQVMQAKVRQVDLVIPVFTQLLQACIRSYLHSIPDIRLLQDLVVSRLLFHEQVRSVIIIQASFRSSRTDMLMIRLQAKIREILCKKEHKDSVLRAVICAAEIEKMNNQLGAVATLQALSRPGYADFSSVNSIAAHARRTDVGRDHLYLSAILRTAPIQTNFIVMIQSCVRQQGESDPSMIPVQAVARSAISLNASDVLSLQATMRTHLYVTDNSRSLAPVQSVLRQKNTQSTMHLIAMVCKLQAAASLCPIATQEVVILQALLRYKPSVSEIIRSLQVIQTTTIQSDRVINLTPLQAVIQSRMHAIRGVLHLPAVVQTALMNVTTDLQRVVDLQTWLQTEHIDYLSAIYMIAASAKRQPVNIIDIQSIQARMQTMQIEGIDASIVTAQLLQSTIQRQNASIPSIQLLQSTIQGCSESLNFSRMATLQAVLRRCFATQGYQAVYPLQSEIRRALVENTNLTPLHSLLRSLLSPFSDTEVIRLQGALRGALNFEFTDVHVLQTAIRSWMEETQIIDIISMQACGRSTLENDTPEVAPIQAVIRSIKPQGMNNSLSAWIRSTLHVRQHEQNLSRANRLQSLLQQVVRPTPDIVPIQSEIRSRLTINTQDIVILQAKMRGRLNLDQNNLLLLQSCMRACLFPPMTDLPIAIQSAIRSTQSLPVTDQVQAVSSSSYEKQRMAENMDLIISLQAICYQVPTSFSMIIPLQAQWSMAAGILSNEFELITCLQTMFVDNLECFATIIPIQAVVKKTNEIVGGFTPLQATINRISDQEKINSHFRQVKWIQSVIRTTFGERNQREALLLQAVIRSENYSANKMINFVETIQSTCSKFVDQNGCGSITRIQAQARKSYLEASGIVRLQSVIRSVSTDYTAIILLQSILKSISNEEVNKQVRLLQANVLRMIDHEDNDTSNLQSVISSKLVQLDSFAEISRIQVTTLSQSKRDELDQHMTAVKTIQKVSSVPEQSWDRILLLQASIRSQTGSNTDCKVLQAQFRCKLVELSDPSLISLTVLTRLAKLNYDCVPVVQSCIRARSNPHQTIALVQSSVQAAIPKQELNNARQLVALIQEKKWFSPNIQLLEAIFRSRLTVESYGESISAIQKLASVCHTTSSSDNNATVLQATVRQSSAEELDLSLVRLIQATCRPLSTPNVDVLQSQCRRSQLLKTITESLSSLNIISARCQSSGKTPSQEHITLQSIIRSISVPVLEQSALQAAIRNKLCREDWANSIHKLQACCRRSENHIPDSLKQVMKSAIEQGRYRSQCYDVSVIQILMHESTLLSQNVFGIQAQVRAINLKLKHDVHILQAQGKSRVAETDDIQKVRTVQAILSRSQTEVSLGCVEIIGALCRAEHIVTSDIETLQATNKDWKNLLKPVRVIQAQICRANEQKVETASTLVIQSCVRATESEASLIVAQVAIRSQLKSELLSNHFTQVLRVQSQTRISQLTADWSIVGTKSRSALPQMRLNSDVEILSTLQAAIRTSQPIDRLPVLTALVRGRIGEADLKELTRTTVLLQSSMHHEHLPAPSILQALILRSLVEPRSISPIQAIVISLSQVGNQSQIRVQSVIRSGLLKKQENELQLLQSLTQRARAEEANGAKRHTAVVVASVIRSSLEERSIVDARTRVNQLQHVIAQPERIEILDQTPILQAEVRKRLMVVPNAIIIQACAHQSNLSKELKRIIVLQCSISSRMTNLMSSVDDIQSIVRSSLLQSSTNSLQSVVATSIAGLELQSEERTVVVLQSSVLRQNEQQTHQLAKVQGKIREMQFERNVLDISPIQAIGRTILSKPSSNDVLTATARTALALLPASKISVQSVVKTENERAFLRSCLHDIILLQKQITTHIDVDLTLPVIQLQSAILQQNQSIADIVNLKTLQSVIRTRPLGYAEVNTIQSSALAALSPALDVQTIHVVQAVIREQNKSVDEMLLQPTIKRTMVMQELLAYIDNIQKLQAAIRVTELHIDAVRPIQAKFRSSETFVNGVDEILALQSLIRRRNSTIPDLIPLQAACTSSNLRVRTSTHPLSAIVTTSLEMEEYELMKQCSQTLQDVMRSGKYTNSLMPLQTTIRSIPYEKLDAGLVVALQSQMRTSRSEMGELNLVIELQAVARAEPVQVTEVIIVQGCVRAADIQIVPIVPIQLQLRSRLEFPNLMSLSAIQSVIASKDLDNRSSVTVLQAATRATKSDIGFIGAITAIQTAIQSALLALKDSTITVQSVIAQELETEKLLLRHEAIKGLQSVIRASYEAHLQPISTIHSTAIGRIHLENLNNQQTNLGYLQSVIATGTNSFNTIQIQRLQAVMERKPQFEDEIRKLQAQFRVQNQETLVPVQCLIRSVSQTSEITSVPTLQADIVRSLQQQRLDSSTNAVVKLQSLAQGSDGHLVTSINIIQAVVACELVDRVSLDIAHVQTLIRTSNDATPVAQEPLQALIRSSLERQAIDLTLVQAAIHRASEEQEQKVKKNSIRQLQASMNRNYNPEKLVETIQAACRSSALESGLDVLTSQAVIRAANMSISDPSIIQANIRSALQLEKLNIEPFQCVCLSNSLCADLVVGAESIRQVQAEIRRVLQIPVDTEDVQLVQAQIRCNNTASMLEMVSVTDLQSTIAQVLLSSDINPVRIQAAIRQSLEADSEPLSDDELLELYIKRLPLQFYKPPDSTPLSSSSLGEQYFDNDETHAFLSRKGGIEQQAISDSEATRLIDTMTTLNRQFHAPVVSNQPSDSAPVVTEQGVSVLRTAMTVLMTVITVLCLMALFDIPSVGYRRHFTPPS